jgi:hypothetical protein
VESSSHHNGDNVAGDKIINNNQRTIHAENYYENYNVKNIYYTKEGNKSTPIPKVYNASIVSIYNANNEIVGSGFLVTSNYIITSYENISNLKNLKVTFALRDPQMSFEAKLIDSNSTHNIALLEIESEEPFNPPLTTTAEYGGEFVVCGFDTQTNSWLEGSYKGDLSDGKQQITLEQEPIIAESFSGAPIWDIAKGGISAMILDSGSMIPIQKVIETFKPLQEALRSENSDILSQEIFKDWVWKSSVESADRLQFSVLALIETVLAVSISFYIWFTYDFYWHIIIGLVVAPLYMLRTKKGDIEKIEFLRKVYRYVHIPKEYLYEYSFWKSFAIQVIYYLLTFLLSIFAMIFFIFTLSLLINFLNINIKNSHFTLISIFFIVTMMPYIEFFLLYLVQIFISLKNISLIKIPKNWFQTILTIDMFYPLETIHGIIIQISGRYIHAVDFKE